MPPARIVTSTTSAPSERLGPVQGGHDLGGVVAQIHDPLDGPLGEVQSLRVDIHQAEGCVLQQRKRQHIANQPTGEAEAARADKCDLGHDCSLEPYLRLQTLA